MGFPFFTAQGHAVGDSLCEEEGLEPARELLDARRGDKLRLPVDLVARRRASPPTPSAATLDGVDVPDGWMGLDIGPRTAARLRRGDRRRRHRVLERPDGRLRARAVRRRHARRRRGRRRRARARRSSAAATAPRRSPSSASPTTSTHLSTGGGASLELIEGKTLPGVEVLSLMAAHAADRRQLEDAQDGRRGGGVRRRRCCRGSRRADGRRRRASACPFTALQAVVDSTRGSRVEVYAQNMHQAATGAFTGEVSAPMLAELDVHGVVLGHSERRQLFGETDRALAEKVPAALDAGLKPILCVGETEDERERGDTERKLRHQVQEGLEKVDRRAPRRRRHRLRADLGDRHRAGSRRPSRRRRRSPSSARSSPTATASRPSARASSTAAGSSPTTRPSCSRCPTSTARSSAAPRSTSPTSRRSSRRPRRA